MTPHGKIIILTNVTCSLLCTDTQGHVTHSFHTAFLVGCLLLSRGATPFLQFSSICIPPTNKLSACLLFSYEIHSLLS